MSRDTTTDFPTAYRLVITRTLAGEDNTIYVGPYQTIGAAKGQLSQALEMRDYEHYETKTGYVERTTGPWEKVES